MNDEIKVGDTCIVLPVPPHMHCANRHIIGTDVVVVGPEDATVHTILSVEYKTHGFACRALDGHQYRISRRFLEKKRPPADDSNWIRQATVPRERFDRWLASVRNGARITEPA